MSTREERQHIQKQLDKLKLEEQDLFNAIGNLAIEKQHIDNKVRNLSKIVPTLKLIKNEAIELESTVSIISNSSEEISKKIRTIDFARSNVDECQRRVGDLIDLELSSEGVQKAIQEEDYEKGAAHVHRFLSMDQSLLHRTATDVENVSSVLKSVNTLKEAASQLRAIIEHKFEEAIKCDDLSSIERFFKIFPLLGLHNEGITKFCNYLCTKLRETAQKNLRTVLSTPLTDKRFNIMFADTVTLLFEGLARIIDIHQPLIETYYGPGHLFSAIAALQKECDSQIKVILAEFNKFRQLNKKIGIINDVKKVSSSKTDKIDPKDLDILIGEITIIHARAELYIKFIRKKVLYDTEIAVTDEIERKASINAFEQLIKCSDLSQKKHELLAHYLQLEQYFMEESVAKAVTMDTVESGQHVSSMVDDTFFIIRKCIRRAVSSGSLDGLCAVINNACGVLENNFCWILQNKLKQGYPSGYLDLTYNVLQTSIQQGRLQPGDTEQARMAFVVALNNADNSIEYVDALCDGMMKETDQVLPKLTANERGKLESCLSGLSSVAVNLRGIINFGMQQLKVNCVKPRINSWVDAFLSINHQLKETELSAYETDEQFVQTVIMNLNVFLEPFKEVLNPNNYNALMDIIAGEMAIRLEKVILKTTFNRLGGLILDKEIRSLAAYLTTLTTWTIRDKFARLTQIATILNFEKVSEISDYWGDQDGALSWRLTASEVRAVMALRGDFKIEDIKKIKL